MVPPDGDKIELAAKPGLQEQKSLENFSLVLVFKDFVGADIAVAIAEMGGFRGLLSGSRRSCDGLNVNFPPRRPAAARGRRANWMPVAKQPGLATFPAVLMASLLSSGSPYTKPWFPSLILKSALRSMIFIRAGRGVPSRNNFDLPWP